MFKIKCHIKYIPGCRQSIVKINTKSFSHNIRKYFKTTKFKRIEQLHGHCRGTLTFD